MPVQDITNPILFGGGYVRSLSAGLGFNTSPSTVDIDIIIDNSGQIGPPQGFSEVELNPGNISGIKIGSFDFCGVIQSWNERYDTGGQVYSVRLVDPRIIFDNVHLILDGRGPVLATQEMIAAGSGLPNVINVYNFYNSDIAADYNINGMGWNRIKDGLNQSGVVTLYDRQFRLNFDDGFTSPEFYRINANFISLNELLNNAASALGIDYYVSIDNYNPNSVINTIGIHSIFRDSLHQGQYSITDFIRDKQASGNMTGYSRGRELRLGPTDVAVLGANYNYMLTATDTYPCYGRSANGVLVTAAGNSTTFGGSFQDYNNADRHNGYVFINNLCVDDPHFFDNAPQVNVAGRSNQLTSGSTLPIVITITINDQIPGYRPTENVMRAALFSRESWEAMLYYDQPNIATQLGINGSYLRDTSSIIQAIIDGRRYPNISLVSLDGNRLSRTQEQEILIELYYQATKEAADTYYGKWFLVELPSNAAFLNSGIGGSLNFRYGYKVVDAAWFENSPNALRSAASEGFRLNDGRIKAHAVLTHVRDSQVPAIVITNPNGRLLGSTDVLKYDFSKLDKETYLIDGVDAYFTVEVEQDITNLARAIVKFPKPIEFRTFIDDKYPSSYIEFWRAVGVSDDDIFNKLLPYHESNPEIGLAPQRLTYFNRINIPIENELRTYGPFIRTANRHGGAVVVQDGSLSPWNYGGFNKMNEAGNAIADQAQADKDTVDVGQFTLAGFPELNIGAAIGDNANITNINISFDPNGGLITNYSLQTFSNPINRLSKILFEKINKFTITTNRIQKEQIKIQEIIKNLENKIGLYNIITKEQLEQIKREEYRQKYIANFGIER